MSEYNPNQAGMPNPNDDQANRVPQQANTAQGQPGTFTGGSGGQAGNSQAGSSEGAGGQQGGGFGSDSQSQQFDTSTGQSGGGYASDTNLLDQVREDMTVLGPDGEECGRVDSVEAGRIKLTRNDSADGQHHYLEADQIEGIEGDEIRLSQTPDWSGGGESSRAM